MGDYELLEEVGRGATGGGVAGSRSDVRTRPGHQGAPENGTGTSPDGDRRFVEEAMIAASSSTRASRRSTSWAALPDGRPYFTMKLVEGRTLAELLGQRPDPDAGPAVPRHLRAGLPDRRLCPCPRGDPPRPEALERHGGGLRRGPGHGLGPGQGVEPAQGEAAPPGIGLGAGWAPVSQAGDQTSGQVDSLDERTDVFGLGAILCEILTGHPPSRDNRGEVSRQAGQGELAETFARLQACGADTDLLALAQDCLAREREARPRHAWIVASRMTAYLVAVPQRLQAAEVGRAAAQARAEEAGKKAAAERRARRLLVLAGGTLLLVLASGILLWLISAWGERKARADQETKAPRRVASSGGAGRPISIPDRFEWEVAIPKGEDTIF